MHFVAQKSGEAFALHYGSEGKHVIDLGGADVNGSLRDIFEKQGMKYTCVDIEKGKGVDVIINPGDKLPFENGTIDLIISTSCFEHDPCFWLTFKEFTRIIKNDGFIYINAPSTGHYHTHPGDNWRFYSDAGQALAYWSGIQMGNEEVFPVKIVETFHIDGLYTDNKRQYHRWDDFICIWKRTDTKETSITVNDNVRSHIGPVELYLNKNIIKTKPFITQILGKTNQECVNQYPLTYQKYKLL